MRTFACLSFMLLLFYTANAQLNYTTVKDVPYHADSLYKKDKYAAERCKLDLYYPKGQQNFPTIIWFHGGGITGGNKEIPTQLMNKGFAVAGVGYRLSPNVKAPLYIEDAAAAIAWIVTNIQRYGGNKDLVIVSGHSAGAYLGMMSILNKQYLAKHKIDADAIASLIPFSGQAITHFTIRQERGLPNTKVTVDEYAPLFFVRPDAPPMILITGDRELELFGRYEENAYLKRMMELAGHKQTQLYELQGFDHGNMPEGAYPILIREVERLIKKQ